MSKSLIYHISKDASSEYSTITEVLQLIPADYTGNTTLYIHAGVYKEQLTFSIPNLTIIGDSPENTILTFDLYAKELMNDGMKRGTFRSYSCFIDTHDFTAKNITFENSSGIGPVVGQALAVYADGDRLLFDNCRFIGNQDTLFTGPLPPKEIEPNGFIGPKQFAPRINGHHCYRNCYIEGDIDFIFGSATAFFENCEFFSKNIGHEINSYVTAASTPEGQEYGYVMSNCRFTSNCPPSSCYIGRPWRNFAKVVLLNCELGEHICKEGWHDWNKTEAQQTVYFAEYNSTGAGACDECRPEWVHILTDSEAAAFTSKFTGDVPFVTLA